MIGNDHVRFGPGAVWKRTRISWHLARRPTSPVQALVAAFAADKTIVDEYSTRAAVAEVTAE